MKTIIITLLILIPGIHLYGINYTPVYEAEATTWADSILSTLSLEEKIAQLIMVTAYSKNGDTIDQKVLDQIKNDKVGGVLFLKSSPHQLARMVRNFQAASETPLFIAIDGENGLSFRMDSVPVYPHLMGLGALNSDTLLYRMGREVGVQCQALGINMNFSPVIDINSNPDNPIINFRSFGENPELVARKGAILAAGMQQQHIVVVAKHFPGHGDTSTDSHHTLPVIGHSYTRLDSVELFPFRKLIAEGVPGIMSAHIHMQRFDNSIIPATMSTKVIQGILKDSLGFDGLVISDAMNMKGIMGRYSEGEATIEAFNAGVDLVEFIQHPGPVIKAVKQAIDHNRLTEEQINQKCRKVLQAKAWCRNNRMVPDNRLDTFLASKQFELTSRLLFEQTLTLLKNQDSLLPLKRLDTLKLATLSIGVSESTPFQRRVDNYLEADQFNLGPDSDSLDLKNILALLKNYNLVLVSLHHDQMYPTRRFGIHPVFIQAIEEVARQNTAILCLFANPYLVKHLRGLEQFRSILVTYSNHPFPQDYSAQMIFGAIGSSGNLSSTISPMFKSGCGIQVAPSGRLKYTIPEEVGISSEQLEKKCDSLINRAISDRLFPGCQVFAAMGGKVFFDKAYGFHTYDSSRSVNNNNLYDLASVTKVAGPLPLIMKMTEDSLLDLDQPISHYLIQLKGTNKAAITLREILTHQAGLKSGILFHLQVLDKHGKYRPEYLRHYPSGNYTVEIAPGLYLNQRFIDSIQQQIRTSNLLRQKEYVYSDLGLMMIPDLLSSFTGQTYLHLLNNSFYKQLGANRLGYQPHLRYPLWECPPTEEDNRFRKCRIAGYVHDESAALMGGISGHAGLFSNAGDLAKLFQMFLQGGSYGGETYLKSSTIQGFTKRQYPNGTNRRALGFDKPFTGHQLLTVEKSNVSPLSSSSTYGHTGFTGTAVWADPKNDLLFIFLSNRTYPHRNDSMGKSNFRPKLHHVFYELQGSFNYPDKMF